MGLVTRHRRCPRRHRRNSNRVMRRPIRNISRRGCRRPRHRRRTVNRRRLRRRTVIWRLRRRTGAGRFRNRASRHPRTSREERLTAGASWPQANSVREKTPPAYGRDEACLSAHPLRSNTHPPFATAERVRALPHLNGVEHAVRQRQLMVRVQDDFLHIAAHRHVDRQRVGLTPRLHGDRDPLRAASRHAQL